MQKKLIVISLFVLLFSLFCPNASAQTATNAASRLKDQMQLLQEQKKAAISQIKQETKETKMELRQQIKETVRAKREAVKEAVAVRREEFKIKLQTIKDEKKKVLVDRIATKLTNVNTKHTDRFTQILSNLQTILDKIGEDVDKTDAQAAIDAAKLAVENQAAKTYTITISTETALRLDVGAVTSQLRQDLTATHKSVVDAKQAVQNLRAENAMMKKEATSPTN